mmetsp:Transcript_28812/g.51723  ORF Transcript_28812/g.51723 Transcript_28812/m.51723 type:complete len:279 (-) Transcript_28812:1894-2730(-)
MRCRGGQQQVVPQGLLRRCTWACRTGWVSSPHGTYRRGTSSFPSPMPSRWTPPPCPGGTCQRSSRASPLRTSASTAAWPDCCRQHPRPRFSPGSGRFQTCSSPRHPPRGRPPSLRTLRAWPQSWPSMLASRSCGTRACMNGWRLTWRPKCPRGCQRRRSGTGPVASPRPTVSPGQRPRGSSPYWTSSTTRQTARWFCTTPASPSSRPRGRTARGSKCSCSTTALPAIWRPYSCGGAWCPRWRRWGSPSRCLPMTMQQRTRGRPPPSATTSQNCSALHG